MNRFKRAAAIIITIEIILILTVNIIYVRNFKKADAFYRVEGKRIVKLLEDDEDLRLAPENINLKDFDTIIRVSVYDSSHTPNNDYLVEEVAGVLYRIEYRTDRSGNALPLMNLGLGVPLISTIAVLLYIGKTIIGPFTRMSDMTVELAKGNLSAPIKQEKSGFFKRFVWGVDMLRENLEDSKIKNLEYQKEKKTLLLSLSHDIKTPLSAIKLYAKALSEDLYETEDEKKEAYAGITAKSDEIKKYVDEIYKLSREDFMEFEIKKGEAYLDDIMTGITAYYRDKLKVVHTEFAVGEYDNPLLSVDGDRLTEAIQNLMENAIKYGDGRKIEISFDDEEDCKLITVSNTGCTLDEKDLNSIFDSFYRGGNTEGVAGNGLGLYIVKQLMKLMDGDVFARIEDGQFKITLVVRKA